MRGRPGADAAGRPLADGLRLAEPIAALSLASDLARGRPAHEAMRATLAAGVLAERAGLSPADARAAWWTTLLRFVGCTATSHEYAGLVSGDDRAVRRDGDLIDPTRPAEAVRYLVKLARGPSGGGLRGLARSLPAARATFRAGARADCEVGAQVVARVLPGVAHGLPAEVERAVGAMFERWDGLGAPVGLAGSAIPLPARVATVAHAVVMFAAVDGPDDARLVLRRWAGRALDPALAATARIHLDALLEAAAAEDPAAALAAQEPAPVVWVGAGATDAALDRIAAAFGDAGDLKAPFLAAHSAGVARLAAAAATSLGVDAEAIAVLRRAAHLHDLGRAAVSTGTWERPGPLGRLEWEAVREHAWHSERIIGASERLGREALLAGRHHERIDGRGYHRALPGLLLDMPARVLAAADAWQAATSPRPHRAALTPAAAARALGDGGLDPDALAAVIDAAGAREARVPTTWPAGLSAREVEILRLLVDGLSIREIAGRLVLSPSTVHTHVLHVYEKAGVSTRAGAAMFAMAHGLIRPA